MKRVTIRQIAERAGVHYTTVSRALKGDPTIPKATAGRIQAIADEMGYRPDPALSSLVAYRRLTAAHVQTPVIAYIMNVDGPEGLAHSASRQLFLKGARAQAEAMGYRLEVFYFGHGHYHSGYLDRVLITRNITGVILAAFYTEPTDLQLSWDFYSLVKIETLPFHVRAHTLPHTCTPVPIDFAKCAQQPRSRAGHTAPPHCCKKADENNDRRTETKSALHTR